MSYIINYKNPDGSSTIIDSQTKKISVVPCVRFTEYPKHFTMMKCGDASPDGLRKYLDDFEKWCKEIRERKKFFVDYQKYYHDGLAVIQVFKNCAIDTNFESFEDIDLLEMKWMNKCFNGGLTFCEPGEYDCHGYDFKMYYPRLLGSRMDNIKLRFPTKKGIQYNLKSIDLDGRLKFGYYHIKITCEHPDAPKVFAFSKNNVYTNYSIDFAYNQLAEFGFIFELITGEADGFFNAYLYDDNCIIESHSIFNNWYYKLSCMRTDFPKNPLVKHLSSSLSGHLISYNLDTINFDELDDETSRKLCHFGDKMPEKYEKAIYDIVPNYARPELGYYKVIDLKKPMNYALGRFKCFLMSLGRNLTATAAMIDLNNVVRIHTDGIVFKKQQNFSKHTDIPRDFIFTEDKTTGRINFNTVNTYSRV